MIQTIFRLNWPATIRMNYHAGGAKALLRLPIRVYGKLRLHLSGRIVLPANAPSNTLIIGAKYEDYCVSSGRAQIDIRGIWRIYGSVHIGPDCFIGVGPHATLTMGDGDHIGRDSQIHCCKNITFGNDVLAVELYAMDSSGHLIVKDGKEKLMSDEVFVGDGTCLSFRTMLLKGCRIPARSVVASGAVVTKDFCPLGERLFLTGVPATVKATGTHAEKDICSR